MQIKDTHNKIIYNGVDGFVAAFIPAQKNGHTVTQIECYTRPSIFDAEKIQQALQLADSSPIGYKYNVIFCPDMKTVMFADDVVLDNSNGVIFLAIVISQDNRFTFFTNVAPNASIGEGIFHDMIKSLIRSMPKNIGQPMFSPIHNEAAAHNPTSSNVSTETGDDEDNDYDEGDVYNGRPDYDNNIPSASVSEEVYALYTGNLLFNLFGDQMLALVCSSKREYNDFVHVLRDLSIVVTPSMNPDGWEDVTRYIMYDIERNTAYATYKLPETVDAVLTVSDFIHKIQTDAEQIVRGL